MRRQAIRATTAVVSAALGGCAVDPVTIGGWRAILWLATGWGVLISPFAVVTLFVVFLHLVTLLLTSRATDFGRLVRAWAKWPAIVMVSLYVIGWVLLPTSIYNFRVTLDVSVEGVTHSGSSVIEINHSPGWLRWFLKPSPFGTGGWTEIRGTAPIVDLGERGWLVASLTSGRPLHTVSYVKVGRWTEFDLGPRSIDPTRYPQFILVPPSNDPSEAVGLTASELRAHTGSAVFVTSLQISPTRDQAADLVESPPEWLQRSRQSRMAGPTRARGRGFALSPAMVESGWRNWLPKR